MLNEKENWNKSKTKYKYWISKKPIWDIIGRNLEKNSDTNDGENHRHHRMIRKDPWNY